MTRLALCGCLIGWFAAANVAHAVDPYVDTGFSAATPLPDADLVIVREQFYGASGVDLTTYGISGGSHDYVQSIYVRLFVDNNGSTDDAVSALIVLPESVSILGIITAGDDLGGAADDGAFTETDAIFGVGTDPDRYSESARGFEAGSGPTTNEFIGLINDNTIAFGLSVDSGVDDFRIIIDYGDSFPPDLSFDILGVDVGLLGGIEPFDGIQVGDTVDDSVFGSGDYGETRSLLQIPLTSVTPAIPGEILPFQPEESVFIARDTSGLTKIDSFDLILEFPLPGMFELDNNVSNPRGITDHADGHLYAVGRDGGFGIMDPETRAVTTVLMANLDGNVVDVTDLPGESDVFGVRNTTGNSAIDRIDPSVPVVTESWEIVEPNNPVAICDSPDGRLFVLGGNGELGWCNPGGTNQSWIDLNPPTGSYDGMTDRPGTDLLYLLRNTTGDTKVDVFDIVTNQVTFDLASLPLPTTPSDITDGPNDLLYVIGDGGANPTAFSAVDPVTGENLALFDILDFTGTYRTITSFHAATSDAPPVEEAALSATVRHFAWPNPFGPSVEVRYELPDPARVEAEVVDVHGRRVRQLRHGLENGGWHTLRWDGRDDAGRDLPNGTYFYRIATGGAQVSGTIVKVE